MTSEVRDWNESLAEFRHQAETLPPGIEKEEAERKVVALEKAIELRRALTEGVAVHKEHRDK